MVDQVRGQLVALKTRWNIQSNRVGIILDRVEDTKDVVVVMWTDGCTSTANDGAGLAAGHLRGWKL